MSTLKQLIPLFLLFPLVLSFFDIQIDRFEVIEQDLKISNWSGVKVRKFNKTTRVLIGDIRLFQEIGNNINVEAKGYKKQGELN